MTYEDLDELYVPAPGEPGWRVHVETGERRYSSAFLRDRTGDFPLTEALEIAAGLAVHPRVAVTRPPAEWPERVDADLIDQDDAALSRAYPADSEGAQVIALQARSRPADGDIGPVGARRRAEPRDPSGRRVAPPEALQGDERRALRRMISQAMIGTARHMERLLALEPDPLDQQILRGRLRQQEILRAMFEDDPA